MPSQPVETNHPPDHRMAAIRETGCLGLSTSTIPFLGRPIV